MKNTFIYLLAFFPILLFSQEDDSYKLDYNNTRNAAELCTRYKSNGFISNAEADNALGKILSVVKHAYIGPSSSYTFELLDGTYQVFFYYGSGWDSNKAMKSSNCNSIRGGFKTQESVSKGDPITLKGNIMEYTLTRSTLGNFSPKSSNLDEAL